LYSVERGKCQKIQELLKAESEHPIEVKAH
jgi:hypothetical protein